MGFFVLNHQFVMIGVIFYVMRPIAVVHLRCHWKKSSHTCQYICKGNDMADFALRSPNDEIEQYQISTNEALWRTFSFQIHERFPSVHWAEHLENGQRTYFTNSTLHQRASTPPQTTLTAFFSLCSQDPFARMLLYTEVPTYYVWMPSAKKFKRREQPSDTLGRLYTAHPNHDGCFFLRLLLVNTRGPKSYEDLKTVNGENCATYRAACQKLGLLEPVASLGLLAPGANHENAPPYVISEPPSSYFPGKESCFLVVDTRNAPLPAMP